MIKRGWWLRQHLQLGIASLRCVTGSCLQICWFVGKGLDYLHRSKALCLCNCIRKKCQNYSLINNCVHSLCRFLLAWFNWRLQRYIIKYTNDQIETILYLRSLAWVSGCKVIPLITGFKWETDKLVITRQHSNKDKTTFPEPSIQELTGGECLNLGLNLKASACQNKYKGKCHLSEILKPIRECNFLPFVIMRAIYFVLEERSLHSLGSTGQASSVNFVCLKCLMSLFKLSGS